MTTIDSSEIFLTIDRKQKYQHTISDPLVKISILMNGLFNTRFPA